MAKTTIWGDFKADSVDRLSLSGGLTYLLNTSDINVVNIEAPVRGASKAIRKSGPSISQSGEAPRWIEEYGFNVVSLANNHTMDFGTEGMETTRRAFGKARVIGCGSWQEAYKPLVMKTADGMRIAFLAATHCEFGTLTDKSWHDEIGTAWLMHPDLDRTIQFLGGGRCCDALIVIAHAGVEYMDVPLPEWRERYHRLIELGADAVIASHPHVPQGWEMYQGKPICYSLGNFCFTKLKKDKASAHWYESLCCVLTIEKPHEVNMEMKFVIYQPEAKMITENDDKVFKEHLNRLNSLLKDDGAYMQEVNKGVSKLLPHYMNQFSRGGLVKNVLSMGFLKGLAEGLLGKGFFKREHWMNNIQCESHRWAILRAMKQKYR